MDMPTKLKIHSVTIVEESWREIKNSTLNKCWSKLLTELVAEETANAIESVTKVLREAAFDAHDIGGEGFKDIRESDLIEIVSPTEDQMTVEEIDEVLVPAQESDEQDKETRLQPYKFNQEIL